MRKLLVLTVLLTNFAYAENRAVPLPNNAFVCIFADPAVGNIDGQVKKMVDAAASMCQVNLIVRAVNLAAGYPKSAPSLKALVKKKCNASDGLRKYGVNRASAIVLTGKRGLARSMNDPSGSDEDVSAEFGFDPGEELTRRARQRGRFGGIAKPGETAVALLGPGHHDYKWMSAVLGQTLMALPPGNGVGFGVGDDSEGNSAGGGDPSPRWAKCSKLREASYGRLGGRFKYVAQQKKYLPPPKAGSRRYDLVRDRPLFGDRSQSNNPAMARGGNGGGSGGGGGSPQPTGTPGVATDPATGELGRGASAAARRLAADPSATSRRGYRDAATTNSDGYTDGAPLAGIPGQGHNEKAKKFRGPADIGSGQPGSSAAAGGGSRGGSATALSPIGTTGAAAVRGAAGTGSANPGRAGAGAIGAQGGRSPSSVIDSDFMNYKGQQEPQEAEWPRRPSQDSGRGGSGSRRTEDIYGNETSGQ